MAVIKIKLSGKRGLFTIVDEKDYEIFNLGSYKWHANTRHRTTYVTTWKNNKMISLHRLIMGLLDTPRSVCVDHIDHDGLNNSRSNLRVTDDVGNSRNSRKRLSATSSVYKGVYFRLNRKTNQWIAGIMLYGKRKYLGGFLTEIEAALAYNKAAKEYFGDKACLNDLSDK